jgi:hypothetical protein
VHALALGGIVEAHSRGRGCWTEGCQYKGVRTGASTQGLGEQGVGC